MAKVTNAAQVTKNNKKKFKDNNYEYSGVKYSKKNRNRNRSSIKRKGKKSSKRRTTMNNKKGKKLSKSFYGGYNGVGIDDLNCNDIKNLLEKKQADFNPNIKESWVENMPHFCQSSFPPDYQNVSGTRDCNDICKIIDTKYIRGDYKKIDSSSKCSCLIGKGHLNISSPTTKRTKGKKMNLEDLQGDLAAQAGTLPRYWYKYYL